MPAIDATRRRLLATTVVEANSLLSRLVGLLGLREFRRGLALWLRPCRAIHTVGMRYPIDALFLDARHRVVRIVSDLQPGQVVQTVPNASSVLELPAGVCRSLQVRVGDILHLAPDSVHLRGLTEAMHYLTNAALAVLYLRFAYHAYQGWQRAGDILPLGLFFVNSLLVYLFLTRRRSSVVSARAFDWFAAIGTVFLSLCLTPAPVEKGFFRLISAVLQLIGMGAIFASLLSLGRSFGVVAAVRPIKCSGMYRLVRHPLYSSELFYYAGFLVGNLTLVNVLLVAGIMVGQYVRAAAEEELLSSEAGYRAYKRRVRWRFVPGVL
ncbi:MAG: DUF192 domain-containing protein [candidate division KSB1 bacterium]|nr:DUF192 domain-containing protein [candidate division KSB1 bacterium]MDZ7295930.1 DUF192 domain-containing protein [candidate division KSB1 bacterium]MDZ7392223.1 DUF192 domain-containing protein [candidate division KSB1 bacterium]MDZ7413787.1 DUF192 domain-containing protein [candidate division KSB1 bacterium]